VSLEEGDVDTETQTHRGRLPREDRGRGWRDVSTSQGRPRTTGHHQELEGARKDPSLELSEGAWPCRHLDFSPVRPQVKDPAKMCSIPDPQKL